MLLLLLAVRPIGAQTVSADPAPLADKPAAEVNAFLESYYDALSDRDWGRFADHFWPGATIGTVWQPSGTDAPIVDLQTVATFVQRAPNGPDSKPIFEERMVDAEISVRGTLALVYARYRAKFGEPGSVAEWEGLDAFVLLRHEGSWRITALTFASDE